MRNHVVLYGNIGKEPEYREFGDSNGVLNFSVATRESWLRDGEWQERTEWHKVAVKSPKAERLHGMLKKGAEVTVHGKLATREYQKHDEKRYVTEVVVTKSAAHNVFIHGKREQQESQGHSSSGGGFDDLPF